MSSQPDVSKYVLTLHSTVTQEHQHIKYFHQINMKPQMILQIVKTGKVLGKAYTLQAVV